MSKAYEMQGQRCGRRFPAGLVTAEHVRAAARNVCVKLGKYSASKGPEPVAVGIESAREARPGSEPTTTATADGSRERASGTTFVASNRNW